MATATDDPTSPLLANVTVVIGFAVIFTTFIFNSPWSWIIGAAMVIAGALWAGFSGTGFATVDPAPEEQTDGRST